MAPDRIVLLGVAVAAAVLLVVRALLVGGEPWWVAWSLPAGAVLVLVALPAGFPRWLVVPAVLVIGAGLGAQLVWAHRRGRYLDDDLVTVWRRTRRRQVSARPGGRHRRRAEE